MAAPTDDAALAMMEAGEARLPVNHDGSGFSWLTMLGFAFLTFNSTMAIYRSNGDWGAISFVAFSYLNLVMLFYSPNASPHHRGKVKAAVWMLTTLLTCVFSYKVVTAMPPPMAAVTLVMTAAGLLGIFYGFCAHGERHQAG